ncbi:MAG: hypothetical protein EOP51_02850 [Sphingobacteriales bacterium]|nr:MAG: hypothetical protein EOP51_02850 [Sphingobacteriales bacterium]
MLAAQIATLFILAIPIACIAWTVTHEEVFREIHDFCVRCSKERKTLIERKFFYLFTCEYCFSHYVTILFLIITKYTLLFDDWRGYIIACFSLVWIANIYMSFYARVRIHLKAERAEAVLKEEEVKEKEVELSEKSNKL